MSPENPQPVTFSLRLPADLAAELDGLADRQKRSRSNVIRLLLREALMAEKAQGTAKVSL